MIIDSENFAGKFAVPQSAFDDLDEYIESVEEGYLVDLLGVVLFEDFKTKYEEDPTFPNNPGYLKILNSFKTDYGSKIYKSKGMAAMLCGFIFFDYMRSERFKATQQGVVVTTSDTAQQADSSSIYLRLNEATETHQNIQKYIKVIHPEQFPVQYNGQEKGFAIPIFG